MSFSGMVKEELSRQISMARHCRLAEITALLSACEDAASKGYSSFQTENYAVVKKVLYIADKNL